MTGLLVSPNGIDRAAWVALIHQHPALHPSQPRVGINPFTGERTEFKAPDTTANLQADGEWAGMISWAEDGSNKLVVDVPDPRVESTIHDVAASLGAQFVAE